MFLRVWSDWIWVWTWFERIEGGGGRMGYWLICEWEREEEGGRGGEGVIDWLIDWLVWMGGVDEWGVGINIICVVIDWLIDWLVNEWEVRKDKLLICLFNLWMN
jgi:hypothetical protein